MLKQKVHLLNQMNSSLNFPPRFLLTNISDSMIIGDLLCKGTLSLLPCFSILNQKNLPFIQMLEIYLEVILLVNLVCCIKVINSTPFFKQYQSKRRMVFI